MAARPGYIVEPVVAEGYSVCTLCFARAPDEARSAWSPVDWTILTFKSACTAALAAGACA